MTRRVIPELFYSPDPQSSRNLVVFFEHGTRIYALAFHGDALWINSEKRLNWVAGTPMHRKAPHPYHSTSRDGATLKIAAKGYGEDPASLACHTRGSFLMISTSFRLIRDILPDAIRSCPHLAGHRKLDLLRQAEKFRDHSQETMDRIHNYRKRSDDLKKELRERCGFSTSPPRIREGEIVQIAEGERYSYDGSPPTGSFRLEKHNRRYHLRGIDGHHRGMLLRRPRGMVLARPRKNGADA